MKLLLLLNREPKPIPNHSAKPWLLLINDWLSCVMKSSITVNQLFLGNVASPQKQGSMSVDSPIVDAAGDVEIQEEDQLDYEPEGKHLSPLLLHKKTSPHGWLQVNNNQFSERRVATPSPHPLLWDTQTKGYQCPYLLLTLLIRTTWSMSKKLRIQYAHNLVSPEANA